MRVLAVIVLHNGERWIEQTIGTIIHSTIPVEIFCVDNCSTDSSCAIVRYKFPSVRIFENSSNLGFGVANNVALKYALDEGFDFVFLLNQDARLSDRNVVERLVLLSSRNPDFGVISPIHLCGEGKRLDLRFSEYIKETKASMLMSDLLLGNSLRDLYDLSFVNAAAWLIPIRTLKIVGGFDPLFFHYGEDDNYCQRVLYHGMNIGIAPGIFVFHDRPQEILNYSIYQDLETFERHLKIKVGNVNATNVRNILDKELGKVKTKFYASLATFQFRRAITWKQYLNVGRKLEKPINESYKYNREVGSNYLR